MKILMLTDRMDIGGAETHVLTLIKELSVSGCEIVLLSSGGVYLGEAKAYCKETVYAPFDKRDPVSIKRSLDLIGKYIGLCDIVHAHTRFTAFAAKMVRRGSQYPPLITTAHLNFPRFPFGPLTTFGDAALAVSEDIKSYLIKRYSVDEKRITVTRNSIDPEIYSPTARSARAIIHTSRIDKGRSLTAFLLVRIAPRLLSIHPDHRIVIVGDGNLYKKLLGEIEKANLALGFDGVIALGKRSDIPSILKYGKIFVGASRAALEGMAAGLATVVSGDDGYGGIVSEATFPILKKTNFCQRGQRRATEEELLSDVLYLTENESERKKCAEYCRALICEHYRAESMANDAYAVYKRYIRAPRASVVGYFGYSNLGDEETLKVACAKLNALGVRDISVLCKKGAPAYLPSGIKAYDRFRPSQIRKCLSECDVLIFCGGNLLQNETSNRSLIYYSEIIAMAKRMKKRVYMICSGFGEISGLLGNSLIRKSLGALDFCGCRTGEDLSFASGHLSCRASFMPDLCFLLEEGGSQRAGKCFALIASGKSRINERELESIGKQRDLTPVIILLFPSEDMRACAEVKSIKVFTPRDYGELCELLDECEFTISERLHGSVFSLLRHRPSYILDNCSKNRALLAEIRKRGKRGSGQIIFPYSKASVIEKKEIGAQDSDFSNIISELREAINRELIKLFQQS